MKLLLLIGAFVLVTHPVHADSEFKAFMPIRTHEAMPGQQHVFDTLEDRGDFRSSSSTADLWIGLCLGEADMRDHQRQKEKHCGCMHQTIFYDQPEKSIKSAVQLCKGKFPPLEYGILSYIKRPSASDT